MDEQNNSAKIQFLSFLRKSFVKDFAKYVCVSSGVIKERWCHSNSSQPPSQMTSSKTGTG